MRYRYWIMLGITMLFVVYALQIASAALTDDINAYYKSDEGNGTVLHDVFDGEDGPITNAASGTWVPGIINNAFRYDSVAYVEFGNKLIPTTGEFTISLWANITSLAATNDIFVSQTSGGSGRMQFGEISNQIVYAVGGSVLLQDPTDMKINDWVHVVVRKNSTDGLALFVNGTVVDHAQSATALDNTITRIARDTANQKLAGGLDEIGFWNRSLSDSEISTIYNGGVGLQYPFPSLTTTLVTPANNTNTVDATIFFNASFLPTNVNLTNATLFVYNSTALFNGTEVNTVIGTGGNSTTWNIAGFVIGNYHWNVFACGDITDGGSGATCSFADSNNTLVVGIEEIANSYSGNTTETKTEVFEQNVSIFAGENISTANLYWNNTARASTVTKIAGNNYSLRNTFDIPLVGTVVKNLFWEVNLLSGISFNTSVQEQNVTTANLSLCGPSPLNQAYINFTFVNETTNLESVSGRIPQSAWTYWIGTGAVNRTLSFSNSTDNPSYAFCFSPQHENINVILDLDYSNAESQQRTFTLSSSELTNVTTNQKLYLLPTVLGIFTRYKTVTLTGDTITNVLATVSRVINGETVTLSTDTTDSSGQVIFFLNPDLTYDYVFSKSGFPDNSFSLQPNSVETYTIVMGGSTGNITNGTQIVKGLVYDAQPDNSSLINNTDYTFSLNVTGSTSINLISMNITNATGSQLLFQSNAGAGFISGTLNTGNHTRLVGRYVIQTSTEVISFTKVWTVGDEFVGDYSIFRQFSLFNDYGFADFIRVLIVVGTIAAMMIFMSREETLDTSESKVMVAVLIIWAFSLVGWLDTGLVTQSTSSTINTLGQFGSQYGIAILSTGAGIFFVFRRIFT